VEESDKHTGTRCPDWVAKGNGTPTDVHLKGNKQDAETEFNAEKSPNSQ